MLKHIVIIIFIVIIIIFLNLEGDLQLNRREINKLELSQVIGVDKSNDEGLVKLSVLGNKIKGESSNSSGSQGGEQTENIITIQAVTFMNAVRVAQTYTEKHLIGGHVKYFLLGEDAAKENINKYMDFALRDREIRLNSNVFICKGIDAQELLKVGNSKNYSFEKKLENMETDIYESNLYTEKTLVDIIKIFSNDKFVGMLPTLQLIEENKPTDMRWEIDSNQKDNDKQEKNEETSKGDNEKNDIAFGGYAIIKDGKLIDYLSEDMSTGYSFLKNKIKTIDLTVFYKDNKLINLNVVSSKAFIKFYFDEDKLQKIVIDVLVESNLNEVHTFQEIINEENLKYIENKQSELIKSNIQSVIDVAKNNNVDFIDIEEDLKMKHPYKWQKIKDKWEENLFNSEIQINVNSEIHRSLDVIESNKKEE